MKTQLGAPLAVAILMAAGGAQAASGSFACKDGFGTMKEVKAQVGGSSGFINIVSLYVARWDAQEARRLCSAYAAGEPVTISCLDGQAGRASAASTASTKAASSVPVDWTAWRTTECSESRANSSPVR